MISRCTVSFGRHDLQASRLKSGLCPVKNCDALLSKAPFRRVKGRMQFLPFCPVHGIRVHKNTFTYFNGISQTEKELALKRSLRFNNDFYINRILKGKIKADPISPAYESSGDALTWNVFSLIAGNKYALAELVALITGKVYTRPADLYLWDGKVDLVRGTFRHCQPLLKVRKALESDIRESPTEPDVMLVIPRKLVIVIEAKFGSGNKIAGGSKRLPGEKPSKVPELIKKYYLDNEYLRNDPIFDVANPPTPFYEELFRDIAFAASMAKVSGARDWFVVNLRSAHVLNLKRGKPESLPVTKNIRSFLMPKYKKQFVHMHWEDIFKKVIKDNLELVDLAWYMKNKSIYGVRAFNII
ncbi:MAG: hypothetical protein HY811_05655 [Planctomycetes bacterium]|nr:hypothetical protein [Planctomycetota bacterium]